MSDDQNIPKIATDMFNVTKFLCWSEGEEPDYVYVGTLNFITDPMHARVVPVMIICDDGQDDPASGYVCADWLNNVSNLAQYDNIELVEVINSMQILLLSTEVDE
jgi:hypothetical protein